MIVRFILFLFALVLSTSCKTGVTSGEEKRLQEWMSDNGKKKILCTTGQIENLVSAVAGDAFDTYSLIGIEHDPHSYQLVKGDADIFNRADILFYNGLGLEGGPSLALRLKDNPKAYNLGQYLQKARVGNILYIHHTPDPHIWMDMALWSATIPFIEKILATLQPEYKDQIKKRAKTIQDALLKEDQELRSLLLKIPPQRRYLVTTHDAFNYFARAYLLEENEAPSDWKERFQAPEGLAPEGQLSTLDIKRLSRHIMRHNIDVVFAESNVSQDSLKKLKESCGSFGKTIRIASHPLYGDALGPPDTERATYMGMMRYNAKSIVEELEGKSHDRP
jgi:manganese/zinc/iron transport system substrate-binding protein